MVYKKCKKIKKINKERNKSSIFTGGFFFGANGTDYHTELKLPTRVLIGTQTLTRRFLKQIAINANNNVANKL